MYEEGTAVFGLGLSARSIATVQGNHARHRFIAGTCSLMEANKVRPRAVSKPERD